MKLIKLSFFLIFYGKMWVFFDDNWRLCFVRKFFVFLKSCFINVLLLVIMIKLLVYLIRWIDFVFWVWLKRYLWFFFCVYFVFLGLVIVVWCLLVILFFKLFRVKFVIKGFMILWNEILSFFGYLIGFLSYFLSIIFVLLGMGKFFKIYW